MQYLAYCSLSFPYQLKDPIPAQAPQAGGGTNPASTEYAGKYKIGQYAQGGVIIWLTEDGNHGLVAAIEDANIGGNYTSRWGPNSNTTIATNNTPLPVQTPAAPYGQYYGGYQNQQIVEAIDSTLTSYPAFAAAASYSKTVDGVTYSDWFLPSAAELGVMYGLKDLITQVSSAHGGYGFGTHGINNIYWSSREGVDLGAWLLSFADGTQDVNDKDNFGAVRCVRAF